jgi:segregation and condensation protein B
MEELKRIIEALLFAAPEPLTLSRIKTIVPGTEAKDIIESIEELRKEYGGDARAFQIVEVANGYQLTTKPDYAIWVDKLFEARSKSRLSRPALETLAVVAYKQPVVRSTIESIRGVNVDGVLRTLMERDLVRIVGRTDGPGRPLLFGTTKEFLLRFGISRISDLPKLDEIENLTGEGAAADERLSDVERSRFAEVASMVEEMAADDVVSSSGEEANDGQSDGAGEETEEGIMEDAKGDVA